MANRVHTFIYLNYMLMINDYLLYECDRKVRHIHFFLKHTSRQCFHLILLHNNYYIPIYVSTSC